MLKKKKLRHVGFNYNPAASVIFSWQTSKFGTLDWLIIDCLSSQNE